VPDFRWNDVAGRFRDARGRFLSSEQVRRAIDATLRNHTNAVAALTDLLRQRALTLPEWERRMRLEVKNVHIYSALAAKGGRAQLTPQDYGRIGAVVKRQYKYLSGFAADISNGTAGNVIGRAKLYAQAGRGTHEKVRQTEMKRRGFDEELNVLAPSEHCDGAGSCVEQTDKGWVPVGSLVPIGGRLCVVNCRCHIRYRNSGTGEVAA
jgi:hypothetical protein